MLPSVLRVVLGAVAFGVLMAAQIPTAGTPGSEDET